MSDSRSDTNSRRNHQERTEQSRSCIRVPESPAGDSGGMRLLESTAPTQIQQDSAAGIRFAPTVVATILVVVLTGLGVVFGVAQSAHSESSQAWEAAAPSAAVIAKSQPASLATAQHRVGARAGLPAQAEPNSDSVVRAYFDAINNGINNGDFAAAWALGGKNVAGVGYSSFVAGFSATSNDNVTINGVTGNTVDVQLDATQTDGSHRFFSGTYTVQEGVIIAANISRD